VKNSSVVDCCVCLCLSGQARRLKTGVEKV